MKYSRACLPAWLVNRCDWDLTMSCGEGRGEAASLDTPASSERRRWREEGGLMLGLRVISRHWCCLMTSLVHGDHKTGHWR